jgi:hypothetical protein
MLSIRLICSEVANITPKRKKDEIGLHRITVDGINPIRIIPNIK